MTSLNEYPIYTESQLRELIIHLAQQQRQSGEYIAQWLGCSRSHICNYYKGRTELPLSKIIQLVRMLGYEIVIQPYSGDKWDNMA